jgi:hypothetical protein
MLASKKGMGWKAEGKEWGVGDCRVVPTGQGLRPPHNEQSGAVSIGGEPAVKPQGK